MTLGSALAETLAALAACEKMLASCLKRSREDGDVVSWC